MRGKDVGRRGGCRARDGVDDGVGCGGVAWAARSAGVCVVSERVCPSPARARFGYRAIPGRGDQPSRFARLRSSRCRRLWSARFWCGDVRRTMARSALCCTGVHDLPAPALERTPRLRRRSPATRQRPWALGRAPHGARGVFLPWQRRCPSGAEPGAQRHGVRVPRVRWHERRPARPGASPRSPLRRDVADLLGVAIAAATRVGPGADVGRQQLDTLLRRSAADGRGRSAPPSQRCTQHSGPDPDRRLVASPTSSPCRDRERDEYLRCVATVAMSRYRAHWIEYAFAPERKSAIAKSVSDW
jgi:hypothetical protein